MIEDEDEVIDLGSSASCKASMLWPLFFRLEADAHYGGMVLDFVIKPPLLVDNGFCFVIIINVDLKCSLFVM